MAWRFAATCVTLITILSRSGKQPVLEKVIPLSCTSRYRQLGSVIFRLLFVKKYDMMSVQQDSMDAVNLCLEAIILGMSGFDR